MESRRTRGSWRPLQRLCLRAWPSAARPRPWDADGLGLHACRGLPELEWALQAALLLLDPARLAASQRFRETASSSASALSAALLFFSRSSRSRPPQCSCCPAQPFATRPSMQGFNLGLQGRLEPHQPTSCAASSKMLMLTLMLRPTLKLKPQPAAGPSQASGCWLARAKKVLEAVGWLIPGLGTRAWHILSGSA